MAILRTELQGRGAITHTRTAEGQLQSVCRGIYDGIAEAAADLTAEQTAALAPGSLMYCLAEQSVCVKTGSGTWEAVGT